MLTLGLSGMFLLCIFGSLYSRGIVASKVFILKLASFVILLVSSKLLANLLTSLIVDAGWLVLRRLLVSSSPSILLILLSCRSLSKTVVMLPFSALFIILLEPFFNCYKSVCSFFVKTAFVADPRGKVGTYWGDEAVLFKVSIIFLYCR